MGLEALLAPRSVAVVGATEAPSAYARGVIEGLDRMGFAGPVYPINPKYETVLGRPCYPDFAALPAPVEAVAFCLGHASVLEPYRDAAAHGARAAVIFDGGFAEKGEQGRRLQAELVAISRECGMALCGPNCLGLINPASKSSLFLGVPMEPEKLAGNVGFIAQSGSITVGMLCDTRRYGFTHAVSSGNEAVVTTADYIDYFVAEPATKVIAVFCEAVRDPDHFVAALDRAAGAGKPVVVLKVGKSPQTRRAIIGHTGAVAGEARVFSEMLRYHRAIEVSDMDEMTEVLAACQSERWPAGRGIGIVTASGGQAELILDIATACRYSLPALSPAGRASVTEIIGEPTGEGNPLDAWGSKDFLGNLGHGLAVMAEEPAIHGIVMVTDTNEGQAMRPQPYIDILVREAAKTTKPCYLMNTRPGLFRNENIARFRGKGIAAIGGARQGLGAIDRLGRWCAAASEARRPVSAEGATASLLNDARRTIDEYDAKSLLRQAGLPVVAEQRAKSLQEVREAARSLGYPVVLKALADGIAHKSEHGLVKVGLADEPALSAAWRDLAQKLARLSAEPSFVVQRMVEGGIEVFAGVNRDPDFGPSLAFGLGGTMVELIDDTALRLLPLREGDVEAMIRETRVPDLLKGFRGGAELDAAALHRCLYRLADFAWKERDRIAEIDVDPLIVLPRGHGCVAVDALIVPHRAEGMD